jgi:DNA-binding transcriptional LysR family regulator
MQFDLDDLKLVALIAETGSLSAAATRMHRSLAAVSARIQNLEQRGGMRFFDRGARGVKATAAGEALIHHSLTMLSQVERLHGDLQQYAQGLRAHVRVFANTTAVSEFLPEILASFLTTHPDVDIDLQERLNADIARAVRDGTTDLGIVAGFVESEGLDVLHFSTDRLVLVVPKHHRLARRKRIAFIDTLDEDHVGMHVGSTLHSFLSRVVEGSGRSYRQRIRLHGFDAMCRMIEAGVGVGVLPESAAVRHCKTMEIGVVRLTDGWAVRERYLLTRHGATLPLAVQLLIAEIESCFR